MAWAEKDFTGAREKNHHGIRTRQLADKVTWAGLEGGSHWWSNNNWNSEYMLCPPTNILHIKNSSSSEHTPQTYFIFYF